MAITTVVPGCVHWQENDNAALFGSPPEILKLLKRAGLSIPTTVVLPEITHANGISQVALEFPAYWHLFFKKDQSASSRIRVIGTADLCQRVQRILRITLMGPTRAMLKSWNISKSRTTMLCNMMEHLAIRVGNRAIELEDIFEFVVFPGDKGSVPIASGSTTTVRPLGGNRYEISGSCGTEGINLNFEGEQIPLWDDEDRLELPQVLGVKLLGTYSGFDTAGPTTGMVLWINCNGFVVDGPVGTARYLRRLGIAKSDLCGVILSHVHDDHCTLIDMILSEHVPNIITTREIFESMLIKISSVIGTTVDEMRSYVRFTEVIAGKPVQMWGARWEFFYTVHSIPTIGFRVTVRSPDDGSLHTIVHSSDTAGFALVDQMADARAITPQHALRMKTLVRGDEQLAIVDGGGLPIHGNPDDYAEVMVAFPKTEFLFYHVNPTAVNTAVFPVATPGWHKTLLPAKTLPQSLAFRLLRTMKLLEIHDNLWVNVLLSQGTLVEIPGNTEVVSQGQPGDSFYFVLSGSVQILNMSAELPQELALLEGGDFFGEMSIILDDERNASVRTRTSTLLFQLPGDLFLNFVEATGLKETFEHLWLSRPVITNVEIFRNLHPRAKHEISLLADRATFQKGEFVFRQGSTSDDFYIITQGEADVLRRDGHQNPKTIEQLRPGDFFGENVAMGYRIRRNAGVQVTSDTLETIRLSGKDFRKLAEKAPIMCHELHLIMKQRGMNNIPTTPREPSEF